MYGLLPIKGYTEVILFSKVCDYLLNSWLPVLVAETHVECNNLLHHLLDYNNQGFLNLYHLTNIKQTHGWLINIKNLQSLKNILVSTRKNSEDNFKSICNMEGI